MEKNHDNCIICEILNKASFPTCDKLITPFEKDVSDLTIKQLIEFQKTLDAAFDNKKISAEEYYVIQQTILAKVTDSLLYLSSVQSVSSSFTIASFVGLAASYFQKSKDLLDKGIDILKETLKQDLTKDYIATPKKKTPSNYN